MPGILTQPGHAGDGQDTVYVVGAGIGGLACAAGLHKAGIKVAVLERSDTLRQSGAAIALQTNAFRALNLLGQGIADALRSTHPDLTVWEYYNASGQLLKTLQVDQCSAGPHELRGVVRNDLAAALQKPLPDGTIRLDSGVKSVLFDEHGAPYKATLELFDGTHLPAKVVIGADGVHSRVGRALNIPAAEYAGFCAFRGLATFEEGLPGGEVDRHTFRFVFGETEGLVGIYPVSATQDLPKQLDDAGKREVLNQRMGGLPHNAAEIARRTRDEDLYFSPINDRLSDPSWAPGRGGVTVIGDAMHPTQPTLAQGGCMAIEDGAELAVVLKRALAGRPLADAPDAEIAAALRDFERRRSARCGSLIAQARTTGRRNVPSRTWLWSLVRDYLIIPWVINEKTFFQYTVWEPSGGL